MDAATVNPLLNLHERAEADLQPYGDVAIVSTFGDPRSEYAAVRKGAGIFDMPHRSFLELTGKDRLAFLNNLLTNQTFDKEKKTGLAPDTGVYAFFLNLKGRVVADMNVLELGERTLLEMDARLVEPTYKAFDRYLFAEQVKLKMRVGELHQFLVTGPRAREAINAGADGALRDIQYLESQSVSVFGQEVVVWRDDPCGAPGYFVVAPTEAAEALWTEFTKEDRGNVGAEEVQFARFKGIARPIGWAVFNTTRVEAGRALFGVDFDDSVLPAETGQFNRAVSVTKGCYLGQEIVARMHARQQVARQVVGLKVEDDALPVAGAKIFDEQQNEIGGVTSSTISPVLSKAAIALAILKKPYFAMGTKVKVPAEGAMRTGVVTELPFVKIS